MSKSTPTSVPLKLSDLVGQHILHGVDTDCLENQYRCPSIIRFKLGRNVYEAVEDPEDDYRSSMDHIEVTKTPCANTFPGVRVIARMSPANSEEILELLNAKTGAVILRVGTENTDDYYPCWVAQFNQENL